MERLNYILSKFGLELPEHDFHLEIPGMNRNIFALLLAELNLNRGVEMGVERGLYSEVLCKANPKIELDSIDAWTAYKSYREHVSQDKLDGFMEETQERLHYYNTHIIKGFSMDVVKNYVNESLDFVYIDGNHNYQNTVNDLCEWSKKVKKGGIVAGHDYIIDKNQDYKCAVIFAVDGYCRAENIKPLFILGAKSDPRPPRDRSRSWFFIKT